MSRIYALLSQRCAKDDQNPEKAKQQKTVMQTSAYNHEGTLLPVDALASNVASAVGGADCG